MTPGVYVHIPFCEQRCGYCAFTVSLAGVESYAPYIERVVREIKDSNFDQPPETIYFGGGTPSIVDAALLERIVRAFPVGASEVSLEANPGTLSERKLQHYRDIGVNRVSVGAQSFNDEDLRIAGRIHSAEDVVHDIQFLRKHGFSNINIDLIAGLPGQTQENWQRNLKWIERLRPEHVSIYMLDVEERSLWGKAPENILGDEVFSSFFREACARLDHEGYIHYEISNWALPGMECRHNLKYWTGIPYRGYGVSAHSFWGDIRFWNVTSLKEYADMVDAGVSPLAGQEQLTREMRIEEAFMLGLRRTSGFDIWKVAADLSIQYSSDWFDQVSVLEGEGWIEFDGKVLKLTPSGWLLASGITEELLWPKLLSISEVTQ